MPRKLEDVCEPMPATARLGSRKELLAGQEAMPLQAISITLFTITRLVTASHRCPTCFRRVGCQSVGEKVMAITATRVRHVTMSSPATEAKVGLCFTDKVVAASNAASLAAAVTTFIARHEMPASASQPGAAVNCRTAPKLPFQASGRETRTLTVRSAIPNQRAAGKHAI